MARKRKLAAAVFSLGCFHASSLMALGLGDLELESFLNEPLKASVDLLNMKGMHADQIRIRLATSEDFAKLGVDRLYFLTTLNFEVVSDSSGAPRILITSKKPVLEPYLDFIVEARWPTGRLLREYTVLVDPPVYSEQPAAVSASERVYEEEGIPAPADSTEDSSPAAQEPTGLFPDAPQRGAGGSGVKTTGTRVDVRESNLAPGAMPQRNFNSEAVARPAPGERYMISRDDTLWQIANAAKPAGTTVHQEMLDIQRLNPDAFINGNINRIKAGYIIYLPTASDISSTDVPAALAEVQAQNEAWREGRDAELYASGGPSLRISADEPEVDAPITDSATVDAIASNTGEAADAVQPAGATPGAALGEAGALPGTEPESRLAEAEQELETLKRIVSLKDDQIAALQNALAEAGVESDAEVDALYEGVKEVDAALQESGEEGEAAEEGLPVTGEADDSVLMEEDFGLADDEVAPAAEEMGLVDEAEAMVAAEPEPEPDPVAEPEPQPIPPAKPEPAADDDGGWMSNLLYIIGAAVLAVLAFVFVRRRREESDDMAADLAAAPVADSPGDVFSEVQLKQQDIEVVPGESDVREHDEPEPELEQESTQSSRGYGGLKHDEYAADSDSSDALAEADIYIAYGRHPQAIDLLNNALEAEPGNMVYRLKLLEIYNELGEKGAATAQMEKIQASGDANSIASAEAILAQATDSNVPPESLALDTVGGESLESDFSELEIEGGSPAGAVEDDLDLSSDFDQGDSEGSDEEELVIADETDGMSTKLDLARAYLDMGDDDGARQILDEIVAEGNDELKTEARALLDRIGG